MCPSETDVGPVQRPLLDDNAWRMRFEEWVHTPEGGQVMNLFIRLAWGVHKRGQKIGAKAIAERIRWHFFVTKAPGELFAVNNNYVAYMARFAMEREPRLAGFFSCRSVRVDSALCPTRSVVVSADTPEES